ncbi:MAG: hypothetical protein GC154_16745 [bacterium]|nr:hypothetical protein [bacterium]
MDVLLPPLSEGADSGTVVSIMVSEGDRIEKDQTILELENEKAIAPIPSTAAGVITKIHVSEGQTISEGSKLISVDEGGEAGDSKKETKKETAKEAPKAPPKQAPSSQQAPAAAPAPSKTAYEGQTIYDPYLDYRYDSKSGFPPPASPTIRKVAKLIGLDLARVPGSGNGGRITLEDIRNYFQHILELAESSRRQPAQEGSGESAPARKPAESIDFSQWGEVKPEKMSSTRKTIARRLQDSWNTVPHVYQFDEADISALMEMRSNYKAAYTKKEASLTLTALAIKAAANVLTQYPVFNSSLDEAKDEIVYKKYVHIGVAVDTENGLVVPVIRDADKKSVLDIALDLQALAEKARARKLTGDDMKGSSFTISNLGGIGGTHFTPIVNPPNTAILGMGRGVVKPHWTGKKFEPRTFLPLCVSYDHRVIDGADGARFIKAMVEAFEQFPESEIKLTQARKK